MTWNPEVRAAAGLVALVGTVYLFRLSVPLVLAALAGVLIDYDLIVGAVRRVVGMFRKAPP